MKKIHYKQSQPIININEKVKIKRRQEIDEIYAELSKTTDQEGEWIYNQLKLFYDPEKTIELFYTIFEQNLSIILTKIKEIFSSYSNTEPIELQDILFQKDGTTFEDRIKNWFIIYDDPKQIQSLFNRLLVILDTEKYNMIPATIKKKTNVEYVEIFKSSGARCDTGICYDYADGEVHLAEGFEDPPYHSHCECEAAYYEANDLDPESPTI